MFAYWISHYGYLGIVSLLMLGIVGLPVPDETLLTFVGFLCYRGELHLPSAVAAAFGGSICGISLSYVIGRTGGVYLVKKYGRIVHITDERLEKARRWFNRAGKWALFFGYFIPGVRHLTAYVAGTSKVSFPVFAGFSYCGGLVWSLTFISLGYAAGSQWYGASSMSHKVLPVFLPLAAMLAVLYGLSRYKGSNAVLAFIRRWLRLGADELPEAEEPARPGDSRRGDGGRAGGDGTPAEKMEGDARPGTHEK